MSDSTLTSRARGPADTDSSSVDRVLGHPLSFIATALILLTLFGWTFVANPARVAPTKDPAYYTWRTEVLLSEQPRTLLDITGPFDMFAGGYRVSASVIGALLRHIPAVSTLKITAFLMVGIPVLTALLLAGFAYRERRDPLLFHAVAFGVASLYLTPPFVGYLDNILCLMFLAAALWFIRPARTSWAGRVGLFVFLVASGFTHPTTLAIFCLTLGVMAAARWLFRGFATRSVLTDDAPALLTAFVAVVTTYVAWKIGIWGRSASLSEAALPPPYGSGFFVDRMVDWVRTMRPLLNGPLFLIGAVGVLAAGRVWVEDELGRVSIVWLAPLAGLFGFVAGIAYPYYRFFNTTLAWVLLVGLGAFFVIRFVADRIGRGRLGGALTAVVAAAIALIFATNLLAGYDQSGWNDPSKTWLPSQTKANLDALRAEIEANTDRNTPIVFVIDQDPPNFQVWGFTKLSGNTSRYALPLEQVDRGYLYLGSLANYMKDEPTLKGQETYDKLSRALLRDADAGVERAGERPVTVVVADFNISGDNTELITADSPVVGNGSRPVWVVHDGIVEGPESGAAHQQPSGNPLHIAWLLIGFAVLSLPGLLSLRWFFGDAGAAEAVGMVPAMSLAILSLTGIALLAVLRAPLSTGLAWLCVALAAAAGGLLLLVAPGRPARWSRPARRP